MNCLRRSISATWVHTPQARPKSRKKWATTASWSLSGSLADLQDSATSSSRIPAMPRMPSAISMDGICSPLTPGGILTFSSTVFGRRLKVELSHGRRRENRRLVSSHVDLLFHCCAHRAPEPFCSPFSASPQHRLRASA